jgi:probable F420-dependent oxidoreductase
MQVGITVRNIGSFGGPEGGVHGCLRLAERAEALGFDSVWAVDHVVLPVEVASRYPYNVSGVAGFDWRADVYEPLVLLSALAQRTQRVQLGVAVLVIPYRHPLVTAKMLATADRISGGRVILGAGAGWLREEFEALGLPAEHFTRRGAVTDDYLRAMKEAWLNTGPARYSGQFVRFTDAGTFPHPRRTPHIPIWAGGKGRRALRRAVRLGDGYIGIAASSEAFEQEVAELRRLAEQDRRDPDELTVALSMSITVTRAPAPPDRAPLAGTPAQIAEGLRAYEAAGLQHLIAGVRAEGDPSLPATLEALEAVAAEALPAVRPEVRV